jgi:hypothetical protein
MRRLARVASALLALTAMPAAAGAQSVRGVVLDQTGLPLPGAAVQLLDGSTPVVSVPTEGDGSFVINASLPGDTVVASLNGFETTRVPRAEAARIVLSIARAAETTTVVAPLIAPSSPTTTLLGNTLTAATVARLPSSRMNARESLPLLPSVVRGPDGLMQLGGARAHETPLFLDGFNVTSPASGLSSINLPFEAVRGVDVLHDPTAVSYGGLLGGMVKIDSKPGGDQFTKGVQGFVPRPRFSSPGFGRIEGIFPRVYAGGSTPNGRLRYLAAAEYDYERIPVPDVTLGRGPDIVEESAIVFTRLDAQVTPRQALTVEGFLFPSGRRSFDLSPRRDQTATSDLTGEDLFAGLTDRFVASDTSVFTIQIGVLSDVASLTPNGSGPSLLSPAGWLGNGFATISRRAVRYSTMATWERITRVAGKRHDLTFGGEVAARRLRSNVAEGPIVVSDAQGRTVRTVEFGSPSTISAQDRPVGLLFRDVWQASDRTQVDGGIRLDHSRHGGGAPSARLGLRYALDASGVTTLKASYGSFVGGLPLAVPAFGGSPTRVDRSFDPATGDLVSEVTLRPVVGRLRLPRAVAATIGVERQLVPGLDAQVALTSRRSSRLATLDVSRTTGNMAVESTGSGRYREVQVSMRRTWAQEQQLFVSYVRSYGRGELNDFATVFQNMDAPLVQAGGVSWLSSDARDRILAWGTFNLPRRVVISPVTEWRSGFPYSAVDASYLYAGSPNGRRFPSFVATDVVVYKTFTVRKRSADFGVQVFNLTNHRNPRDVYPVVDAPRFGQFTNSVGPIFRGYMLLRL